MSARDPVYVTPEIADRIIEHVAAGHSVRSLLEPANAERETGLPCRDTWQKFLAGDVKLQERMAAARSAQADVHLDELVAIADAAIADPGSVAQAKLRIDTRKCFMALVSPKKYGEKLDVKHSGNVIVETVRFTPQEGAE